MKMNERIEEDMATLRLSKEVDGVRYFNTYQKKDKKTSTVAWTGLAFFAGLIIWAALTGHTLQ